MICRRNLDMLEISFEKFLNVKANVICTVQTMNDAIIRKIIDENKIKISNTDERKIK